MILRLLILLPLVTAWTALCAEISPISVRVEQVVKGEHLKFVNTQEKALKVFLTNASDRDFPAVTIKYYHFARDVTGGEVALYEKGEKTAAIGPHATVMVETPAAKARYIDEHTEGDPFARGARKGGGGGKLRKTKAVPARGKRIVGDAVQVFAGGRMVGESYSEPSLKAKLGH